MRAFISRSWAVLRTLLADAENPALVLAQARILIYQAPMMYGLLVVNTWGVVLPHARALPWTLAWLCPSILTLACAQRIYTWQKIRKAGITIERATSILCRSTQVTWLLAPGFTAWALLLLPFGDLAFRLHVAFYMAITVIGC